jgi:hypothetical protein
MSLSINRPLSPPPSSPVLEIPRDERRARTRPCLIENVMFVAVEGVKFV